MKTNRYTVDQIKKALQSCKGLVYLAAKRLGCSSKTVTNYLNRYTKLREQMAEMRGQRVDRAEDKLDQAVMKGEGWAIQFTLRTQGKDRGYGETVEHT